MANDQMLTNFRKLTRRDEFLMTMKLIDLRVVLREVVESYCPKVGNGRLPIGLERMLRNHFVQYWFNLVDTSCEQALCDSVGLRRFVGIEPGSATAQVAALTKLIRRSFKASTTLLKEKDK